MQKARPLVFVVLVVFVAFTAWVIATGGSLGEAWAYTLASPWTMQLSIDLVLALTLVCVWMWNDARRLGRNPIPWIVATLFTGSIAPLTYLLLRPAETGESA